MRISQESLYRTILQDIFNLQYKQFKTEGEISTGQTVSVPSDAPAYAVTILGSRQAVLEVAQYQTNLESANTWMVTSESAIQSLADQIERAQVLAEQMATGTYDSLEYQSTASEVRSLIEQIVTLANTTIKNSYIFGGTRTELPPITASLQETGLGPGHGTQAATYYDGTNYYLQFARDTQGDDATFTITGGTLGASLGLDFTNYTTLQSAGSQPPQGEIIYFDQALGGLTDAVSARVGEELTWTADTEAGQQTFRTEAVINVNGTGSVDIDGVTYGSFSDAAGLVELVNAAGSADYFAWLEGSSKVHIVSKGTGSFSVDNPTGEVSVDQTLSMQDLISQVNGGQNAVGTLHLAQANLPLATDTVTLGEHKWTWQEITAGLSPTYAEDYADALASWITANTDEYSATAIASGTGATVQISARAAGTDGNVALNFSLSGVVTSSYLYGGSDPTKLTPLSTSPQAEDRASLLTDSAPGHGTVAASYNDGALLHLQFSRDTQGADATFTMTGGTLGASEGLDFNTWLTLQEAAASPPAGEIIYVSDGVALATDAISSAVGETLTWTADSDAGSQTYRTEGLMTVSALAGGTVDINGVTYAADSAATLVEAVNAAGSADYFAWLEGTETVHIVSRGTGASPFVIDNPTANVVLSGDAANTTTITTLSDVNSIINSGVRAAGMLHLDDGALPVATDTITLGDMTWTWDEITGGNLPADAAGFAGALASWVEAGSDDFSATVTTSGTGATVQIQARAVGKAGNVTLAHTISAVATTDALYGGLDGTDTDTPGRLYGTGTADLRLGATINATVIDVDGDTVTMRLRWYDDYGNLHVQEAAFDGGGEENAVEVTGMGGLKVFCDSMDYNVGSVFNLEIGHYQGNEQEIDINFSQSSQMSYNWTARQLLGENQTVNLLGETATAKANTGTGSLGLAGAYQGQTSRELLFQVTDAGQVPGDSVTLQVSWTGDDGVEYSEDITISSAGQGNAVEIPGCDGVEFYLDNGTFAVGDKFHYEIEKNPVGVLDTLAQWEYQLSNGSVEEAQDQSQKTLDVLGGTLQNLLDYLGEVGTRMDRVTVRENVLEDQNIYSSETLSQLQDVNLTEAFMQLQSQYTAYGAALEVVSVMSEMYLTNLI